MKNYHDIVGDGGSNVAAQVEEQARRLELRLSRVRHTVAVMSGKGGVGKSLVSVCVANALALTGRRVGLLDADINGASVVKMTGVERKTRTVDGSVRPPVSAAGVRVMSIDLFLGEGKPVRWNAPSQKDMFTWRGMIEQAALREMVTDTEWGELDYLMIDLPPGSDRLPNLADLLPRLSAAVVVTVPSAISEYVVGKSIQTARELLNVQSFGLVENMSFFTCPDCGESHDLFRAESGAAPADWHEIALLGRVPLDPTLSSHTDGGRNFLADYPESEAARAIAETAEGLMRLTEGVTSEA